VFPRQDSILKLRRPLPIGRGLSVLPKEMKKSSVGKEHSNSGVGQAGVKIKTYLEVPAWEI
jgi:hypothetical protein